MDRNTRLSALLRHRRLTLFTGFSLVLVLLSGPTPLSSAASASVRAHLSRTCSAVADAVAGTAGADQLVTVVAASTRSTTASLVLYRRVGSCFRPMAGPYSAFVGLHGLSAHHREGDGTTPLGLFPFQSTMYGQSANPGVHFHFHQLSCGDWWDEDVRSAAYNHFVHLPCGATPTFGGDSEALWENIRAYGYFAVIAYNRTPIVAGAGSAIFLHVSKGAPTTGCVSIAKVNLVHVLRALQPALHPLIYIAVGTTLVG